MIGGAGSQGRMRVLSIVGMALMVMAWQQAVRAEVQVAPCDIHLVTLGGNEAGPASISIVGAR